MAWRLTINVSIYIYISVSLCMYNKYVYIIYIYITYIYMGASSFPHPYISASSVVRPIQYSAKDVLTLVMPHTAKCGIFFSSERSELPKEPGTLKDGD